MSENKKPFSPWIPTVILGVVTILFSFYALQEQTEAIEEAKRIEKLEGEVTKWKREAEIDMQEANRQREEVLRVQAECEAARKKAEEDCKKTNKRK